MKTSQMVAEAYGMYVARADMSDKDIKDWARTMKIEPLEDVEYRAVLDALFKAGYNKRLAAKALGISYQQLRYRLIKWGKQAWEG